MNILRTWAVLRKEARHILRDRRAFFLVTISPVFLLLVMACSFSVDIKHVAVAVMDRDGTPLSRRYLAGLGGTGDVLVRYVADEYADLERWLMTSEAKAAIVIPPGFEADLRAGREASIQVIIEGTDPKSGSLHTRANAAPRSKARHHRLGPGQWPQRHHLGAEIQSGRLVR
jgi:ABC-type Na+ efflux pump permease subunit